jgi:hypothetical protein
VLALVLFWRRAGRRARAAMLAALVPAALAVGGLRMAFGRHFLSDVVFAVLLCALVLALLYRALGMGAFSGATLADLRADAAGALAAARRLSVRAASALAPRRGG